jgi:RNA polymerase sigma-70 factor (ECF subfamily)
LAGFRGKTEREWLAWLRQLLLHNLANFARSFHTAKRAVRCEEPLHKNGVSSQLLEPSPVDHAIANELAELVHEALRRVPRHYRWVIVCRYLDRRSFKEISERAGRSENAVRKLFARALQRMQRELERAL